MIKSFLISFITTLCVIITVHNIIVINRSLDRCEQLAAQIEAYGEYYEQNFANKHF